MRMKKRAVEGVCLLAILHKHGNYSFNDMINKIIEVTNANEEVFFNAYHCCLDFLSNKIEDYHLDNTLRKVLTNYLRIDRNSLDIELTAKKYFNLIESDYLKIENRNELYMLKGNKFARIYNFELNQKNQVKLYMSIVTDNIIKLDSIMFNKDISDYSEQINYRPYFVEFNSDYFDMDYLTELKLDIPFENDIWVKIDFVEQKSEENNKEAISGEFIFSASPLKIGKKTIQITNVNVPDYIKNHSKKYLEGIKKYTFDVSNKNFLDEELSKLFPKSNTNCQITIFNVGQGSLNFIEINNFKLLFDIGDSFYEGDLIERKNKEKATNIIKRINPDCVILSHFDLDHILGIAKMTDNIFDGHWIVPDITEKNGFSDSALRLICFLAWYDKTTLISIRSNKENMNNSIFFSNNVLELGKGNGKTYTSKPSSPCCGMINSLNFQNNFGLVLKVKGKKEHIIFAGDCEYEAFPRNFMTQYPQYLVAPHHGSKMAFNCELDCSKAKYAFISSGKNYYNCLQFKLCKSHPHTCHIDFLEILGYSVYQTKLTSYYTFNL